MKSFSEDNQECTVISSVARFSGVINGSGRIVVRGFVNGEIKFAGEINIELGGKVEGKMSADNLLVNGNMVGNAKVANQLSLRKASKMEGDAEVGKLSVEEGAEYCGKISMKGMSS